MQVADDLTWQSILSMGWMLERMCDLTSASLSVRNLMFIPSPAQLRWLIAHQKQWKSAHSRGDMSQFWCHDEVWAWYLFFFWCHYFCSPFGPARCTFPTSAAAPLLIGHRSHTWSWYRQAQISLQLVSALVSMRLWVSQGTSRWRGGLSPPFCDSL